MFCLTASLRTRAGVAELVDARDSKSRFFGSVGSSPTTGTIAAPLGFRASKSE